MIYKRDGEPIEHELTLISKRELDERFTIDEKHTAEKLAWAWTVERLKREIARLTAELEAACRAK